MAQAQNTHVSAGNTPVQTAVGAQVAQTLKPKVADNQTALLALLKVEAEARDATSERDLVLLMANETRKLTRARQIFVVMPGLRQLYEVQGVSSIPVVDRSAPLIIFIERLVRAAAKAKTLNAVNVLKMPPSGTDTVADSYPFRELVWLPLKHKTGTLKGGLVLAREQAWADQDLVIAARLSSAYAHALQALKGPDRNIARKLLSLSRWHAGAALAVLMALLLVHVPLSALAPAEIVARDPFVVAAPIDGVIDAIAVDPNQPVARGDLLVKLADTTLRNRYEVASREVQVAEARLKQSNQVAFSDPRGMHEIGISRAELALKIAERDFTRDLLEKSEIRAQRDGIAMYSDKRDLVGRPVAVGERILEVADQNAFEARIELPVADAIALSAGARVRLFLDSDPLRPWDATVRRADYKAKIGENDIVSFRVIADVTVDADRPPPRLGVRGTAQVSGDRVSLGYYLFRRPLTALRQWIGR
ncbi:MAG TPA: HlyD family efflux transporter periplasmic adaptor subunit [Hyphomicrobium sp.]|nr:HlyD family efflux transporter periplasmic adaptor subunit [Hyphomicrobium sp.]